MTAIPRQRTAQPARTRVQGPAVVDLLPTCGCGQALDGWRTCHCPRCGVSLCR